MAIAENNTIGMNYWHALQKCNREGVSAAYRAEISVVLVRRKSVEYSSEVDIECFENFLPPPSKSIGLSVAFYFTTSTNYYAMHLLTWLTVLPSLISQHQLLSYASVPWSGR